jgi:hypothetical protein
MKPMEKDWEENNMDMLLFEYLEGDLSKEQTLVLDERLVLDAFLQGEMACWQVAFIKQDFYDTAHLEKSLLKEEVNTIDSTSSGFMLIFTLLTSLFSFFPLTTKKESIVLSTPTKAPISEIIRKQEVTNITKKELVYPQIAFQVAQKALLTNTTDNTLSIRNVKIEALAKPQILSLQTKPVSIDIPRAGLHKIQIKKTATLRKVSGKERRRIERMKERVLQRRVAN